MQRRDLDFTFLIFLISESSSDGAAAGLAWIFSLSLSSPAICQRGSQKPVWSHLLCFFPLTLPECKHSDRVNGAEPVIAVSPSHFSLSARAVLTSPPSLPHNWYSSSVVFYLGHIVSPESIVGGKRWESTLLQSPVTGHTIFTHILNHAITPLNTPW